MKNDLIELVIVNVGWDLTHATDGFIGTMRQLRTHPTGYAPFRMTQRRME